MPTKPPVRPPPPAPPPSARKPSPPDAARFRDLVAKRRDELAACFARVDRARAMGDIAAAREAAAFIRDNATLDGETADRLRAEAILRALPPPPQQ